MTWCLKLASRGRATRVRTAADGASEQDWLWVAAERLPEVAGRASRTRGSSRRSRRPRQRAARVWTREDALVELLRGRLSIHWPDDRRGSCASMWRVDQCRIDAALLTLESEGVILRGIVHAGFATPSSGAIDDCSHGSTATR